MQQLYLMIHVLLSSVFMALICRTCWTPGQQTWNAPCNEGKTLSVVADSTYACNAFDNYCFERWMELASSLVHAHAHEHVLLIAGKTTTLGGLNVSFCLAWFAK